MSNDFEFTQEMRDAFKREHDRWSQVYKVLRKRMLDNARTTDQKPKTEGRVLGS